MTIESRSKQRFSLLQEKLVIQVVCLQPKDSGSLFKSPVLGLTGGLWVFRKSQKLSTVSDF